MTVTRTVSFEKLTSVIQRQIDSLYYDERVPIDNLGEMSDKDLGMYQALNDMLLDSMDVYEQDFIVKYSQKLKSLKSRVNKETFISDQETNYLAGYTNKLASVLSLITVSPSHHLNV
ncbi:MAG: hypothetical protein ABJK64_07995 [Paraglaciecola sp.]|uniref:hypothetical protein n=1 Tax=Paraglaciecola sp. TaxID=1920173 RepID=UPI00329831DA